MRCLLLLIAILTVVWPAVPIAAQEAPSPADPAATTPAVGNASPAPPVELSSPLETILTFLDGMNQVKRSYISDAAGYNRAFSTMDFGSLTDIDREARADKLYQIFNRIERVDGANADLIAESREAVTNDKPFVYFPQLNFRDRLKSRSAEVKRQVLEQRGTVSAETFAWAGKIEIEKSPEDGAWRFSTETINNIPLLYEDMAGLDPVPGVTELEPRVDEVIEAIVPRPLVENSFLGLKYWRWVLLFVLILIGVTLDLLIRGLLRLVAHRLAGEAFCEQDETSVRRTMRPIGLLAAGAFWLLTFELVGIDGLAETIIAGALAVFTSLAGVVSAWRVIDLVAAYLLFKASKSSTRIDDVLIPLIRTTAKLFVAIVAVVWLASVLDVLNRLWPLVASLGIGSVAFAFAAKDTVENFFGSIAVLLDRPFSVGDWVVIEGHEGIVEQVGFRSTRVRTFYNSQITIPNSNLVRAVVDNYGRRRYRRWKTMLGVQYDTSPEQLAAFTEGIRELIRLHPYTRKDYYQVYCNEFGESSLQVLLYMFFEVPDWNTELRERDRLFRDIVRLADALGVSFAFPTQTVHLYKEEHRPPSREHEDPDSLTDGRASVWGIRAAKGITRNQAYVKTKPDPVVIQTDASDDEPAEELDDAGNPIEKTEEDEVDTETDEPTDDRPHELKGGS
ncbi:MAG: mechanosensitive ion channel domain-containing protein [Planctomycetota bacterium]